MPMVHAHVHAHAHVHIHRETSWIHSRMQPRPSWRVLTRLPSRLCQAFFNHSCSPNCSVSAGARNLEVVADEEIAPDPELTISYCALQQPRGARQKLLHTHYRFECACERCTSEAKTAGGKA